MTPLWLLLFLGAGFAGSVVQSTCGFGLGIVMMTVLPYLLPSYGQATALSSLCSLVQSSAVAWRDRAYLRWRIVLPPLVANMLASATMIVFATRQSDELLTRALGALLILLSLYFLFFNDKIHIRPTLLNSIGFGLLSGVGSGLFSIGGPPIVIYMLAVLPDKREYRASANFYFAMSGLSSTLVRASRGMITLQLLGWCALALVALAAGTWVGNRIFNRIDAVLMRKAVYGFMAVSGGIMLFN